MTPEPGILTKGKRFHREVQEEWLATAKDGVPCPEKQVTKGDGKQGRVDILVDELGDYVSVIEIKATDWDRMKPSHVNRNIRRQVRQIWNYIDSQIYLKDVCPAIIFQKLPQKPGLLELVENSFDAEGIQVVWHDETFEQARARNAKKNI